MKVIYRRNKPLTIYTVVDLAEAVGLGSNLLWQQIHRQKALPEPLLRYGKRRYYGADQFEVVKDQLVARLVQRTEAEVKEVDAERQ